MSKENGGPAFPVLHSIDGNWISEPREKFSGMTLRDWFAAKASEEDIRYQGGVLLDARCDAGKLGVLPDGWRTKARYMHADAMLAERLKP